MQHTTHLLAHFDPQIAKARPNANDPPLEAAVLHQRFNGYTANFPQLGAYLKPDQHMANYIRLELERGKALIPIYTPYIVPDITSPPWPFPTTDNAKLPLRGGLPVVSRRSRLKTNIPR